MAVAGLTHGPLTDQRNGTRSASRRRVITFDNRSVGATGGSTPDTIEAVAHDAVAFIRTLRLDHVDLLGMSMGGFVAQQEPQLVRRIILAGTGPAGGEGIDKVTRLMLQDIAKGALTFQDPQTVHLLHPNSQRAPGRARPAAAPKGTRP
jgi:pimeloyl-ACP methyl ester carboxylesterase